MAKNTPNWSAVQKITNNMADKDREQQEKAAEEREQRTTLTLNSSFAE